MKYLHQDEIDPITEMISLSRLREDSIDHSDSLLWFKEFLLRSERFNRNRRRKH